MKVTKIQQSALYFLDGPVHYLEDERFKKLKKSKYYYVEN